MPGPVILVHSSEGFANQAASALRNAGYEVVVFTDPMQALDALDATGAPQLLITRVNYPSGKPNGVALALMARNRRPHIRVLFIAQADMRQHAEGIGEFLPVPVALADLVAVVERLLPHPPAPAPTVPMTTIRDPVLEPTVSGAAEGLRALGSSVRRLLRLAAKTVARSPQLHDHSVELPLTAGHYSELAKAAKPK
jgi:DNA-binding NtrC family response regulator